MRRCLALLDPTAQSLLTTQPRFRSPARREMFALKDHVFRCRALAATSARRRRRRRSCASRPSTARSRTARPRPSARLGPSATSRACASRRRARRARMCPARARSRATRAPRGASAKRRRRRCCARKGFSALERRRSRSRARRTSRALRDRGGPSDLPIQDSARSSYSMLHSGIASNSRKLQQIPQEASDTPRARPTPEKICYGNCATTNI